MNYFAPSNAAERYAQGRPNFHANTIQKVKTFLQIKRKLPKTLDIACGTGLSTQALLAISKTVYATDTSDEMLKRAFQNSNITYSLASAENQPFDDATFDLITVCSAVHWFDIDAFLLEANRLLKPNGYLVLYDNFFIAKMNETTKFSDWYYDVYLDRFPAPKRNNAYDFSNENLNTKGFSLILDDNFTNEIEFSKQNLILYFTTQSNIICQIENGQTTYSEVENWLNNELSYFFSSKKVTIHFGNWLKIIQKTLPTI